MSEVMNGRTVAEVCAPFACVAHCAAMPLVSAFAPALAPLAAMEPAVIGISVLAVGWVLVRGFREHGSVMPAAPAGLGFAAWFAALSGLHGAVPEIAMLVVGSVLGAAGAFWNARKLADHRCERVRCGETDCCEEPAADVPRASSINAPRPAPASANI